MEHPNTGAEAAAKWLAEEMAEWDAEEAKFNVTQSGLSTNEKAQRANAQMELKV